MKRSEIGEGIYMSNVDKAFEQLQDIVKTVSPIWERNFPDEAELQNAAAERKLKEEGIRLVIYGAYNAGKSTLVNLLMGKHVAEVGEIPITDTINSYDWHGITIIDTPGVNAPIEHEDATREVLKENDLVVFVVREGNQDTADVYDRLLDCQAQSKHIFLLLNHESLEPGNGENGTEQMESHVLQQLFKQHQNRGSRGDVDSSLIEQLRVLPINLAQAYKGRVESKLALVEHSGYYEFIDQFNVWLKSHESDTRLCARVCQHLDNYHVRPLIEKLQAQQDSDELALPRNKMTELHRFRDNTEIKAINAARHIALTHKKELVSSLQEIQSESEAQDLLERFMQNACDQYSAELEALVKSSIALKIEAPDASFGHDEKGSGNQRLIDDLMTQGFEALQNSSVLDEAVLEPMIRSVILKLQGSGYFFKTMTDDAIKALAPKIAARAAIGLQVVFVAWTIYSSSKEQEEGNERERNRTRKIKQVADSVAEQFMSTIKPKTGEVIDAVFSSTLSEHSDELKLLSNDANQLQSDLIVLERARSRLLAVNLS
ncbi:MAG: hypothetical protein EA349_03740 [Halomonadaceae bacterium]|nr:MAG: hypothetical protein EA349_03740 [Halomonadaceae bacterium]